MKKYAITLFILTLIGIGLTILLFTQDEKLDQMVFQDTTESIRNLQTLDKNLLVLLNQSRFNSDFDHDTLIDTSYELSEEFSNLRYEALFEEIEASPALSRAVKKFDDSYAAREQELEIYAEANSAVSKALPTLSNSTNALQSTDLGDSEGSINSALSRTNAQIYAITLGNKAENLDQLLERIKELTLQLPAEPQRLLSDYESAVASIIDNNGDAETSFNKLTSLNTGPLLDSIENEYVNYHKQAIGGSTLFRNALIVYGVVLLGALIFFGAQIRRNYLFLEQEVADRTVEIKNAYDELQESQEQLIQSEKMASLGQMVAGVAHEINTPLGYVSSNIETLKFNVGDMTEVMNEVGALLARATRKEPSNKDVTKQVMKVLQRYKGVEADELVKESEQLLGDSAYGLTEISKLVLSLKDFSRLDRQNTEQMDVHDCIESSLTIGSNHIRENNVEIIKKYSELPSIFCVPSKLNQLFLNVITNACQAMGPDGGSLTIQSWRDGDKLRFDFTDQGVGMDEATQQKMFDPFFTSKEIGEGTGLGMSIAYKIITAHNGSIEVDSELGKGTTLSIILPAE